MINMQILFSFTKMGHMGEENNFFCVIFLNKDISITTQDIALKFSMTILHIFFKGSMSQILYSCHIVYILCDL